MTAVPQHAAEGVVPYGTFGVDTASTLRDAQVVAWSTVPFDDGSERGVCVAATKKGEPCKGKSVEGDDLCIGHVRAREAMLRRQEG